MKKKIKKGFLLLALPAIIAGGILFGISPAEAESQSDVLIIAHKSVKADSISIGELKVVFLKKKGSVKGSKVIPVNAKSGSSLRKTFQKRVLGMTDAEEKAFWETEKIKKGISKPPEIGNTVRAIFSVKGGISYCYRSQYKAGVGKILLTL